MHTGIFFTSLQPLKILTICGFYFTALADDTERIFLVSDEFTIIVIDLLTLIFLTNVVSSNFLRCCSILKLLGLCIDTDIRRYIDRYDIIYLSAEGFCRYLDIYRRRCMRYIGVFPHC